MLIIRPDTLVSKIHTNYPIASVSFSLITFSVIILWAECAARFPVATIEKWKVYNELLLTISCIFAMGILNYAYILFFGNSEFSFSNFNKIAMLEVISFTLGSGFIPLLLFTLVNFLRMEVKRKRIQPDVAFLPQTEEKISTTLSINEGGESFQLDLNEVILIESMGNYIKIYERQNNLKNAVIVRLTMNRIEQLLHQQKFMMRVHRSYVVNTTHIERVHKSSSGDLNIVFQSPAMTIPVSRNKKKELADILKFRNTIINP